MRARRHRTERQGRNGRVPAGFIDMSVMKEKVRPTNVWVLRVIRRATSDVFLRASGRSAPVHRRRRGRVKPGPECDGGV